MHQQLPPEQCGNPSPMAQPIVLCPFQLVYDTQTHTPMLLQHTDQNHQTPQPMVITVQNPPPWIQNQTQNVIYVQQTPHQMLPYLQQNMIPNPIFQAPYIFPQMVPQEPIRPVMQIPPLVQKETIQNQTGNLNFPGAPTPHENITQNLTANINFSGGAEKIPFMAQNQINAAFKTENIQLNEIKHTVGTETMLNTAPSLVYANAKNVNQSIIAQNQINTRTNAETTTIVAQTQRHPQERTEKISILTNLLKDSPLEYENKPKMQDQHVQTDFPIAKTSLNTNINANQEVSYVPINFASQNYVKPMEVPRLNSLDTRQYNASNLYEQKHIRPIRPNVSKSQEISCLFKSKIPDTMSVRTIYRPILPRPVVRPYEFKGTHLVNSNLVTLQAPNHMQTAGNINYTKINHNINLYNVNNYEKATEISNITSMSSETVIHSNRNNLTDLHSKDSQKKNENTVPIDNTEDIKINIIRIKEQRAENNEVKGNVKVQPTDDIKDINKTNLNTTETKCTEQREIEENLKKNVEPIGMKQESNDKGHANAIDIIRNNLKEKQEKVRLEMGKDNNVYKETASVNRNNKDTNFDNDTFILTHVLDGHVIQESNVAFPIHNPLKEKISHEPVRNDSSDWKTVDEPLLPLKYLHIIDIDRRNVDDNTNIKVNENTNSVPSAMARSDIEGKKDNPFLNVTKSTVEAWNMEQLSSHLITYGWKETATKLRDQELDGESLLLVSEKQLLDIGVSEQHAGLICQFVSRCVDVI